MDEPPIDEAEEEEEECSNLTGGRGASIRTADAAEAEEATPVALTVGCAGHTRGVGGGRTGAGGAVDAVGRLRSGAGRPLTGGGGSGAGTRSPALAEV